MTTRYGNLKGGDNSVKMLLVLAALLPAFGASCAVDLGEPGDTDLGELGDEETAESAQAIVVDPDTLSAGDRHTCAVRKTDGTAWCWGDNTDGKLGIGAAGGASPIPVQVKLAGLPFDGVTQVSAGAFHTCAVRVTEGANGGTVWCWGSDSFGQIGDGAADFNDKLIPVMVTLGGQAFTGVSQVSAGAQHTCAVKVDGSTWCWGHGGYGQLGNGASLHKNEPVQVVGVGGIDGFTGAVEVSAGDVHTCAIKAAGTAYCWGGNYASDGLLGHGITAPPYNDSNTPVQVVTGAVGGSTPPAALSGITQIDAGARHTCAVGAGGEIWCWGSNRKGALGINEDPGVTPRKQFAVQVRDESGSVLTGAIRASTGEAFGQYSDAGGHSCALKKMPDVDGVVVKGYGIWCWGDNKWFGKESRLAISGAMSWKATPALEADNTPFYPAAAVDVGAFHSCAVKPTGTVWCWGNNEEGRLGIGAADTDPHTRPLQVRNFVNAKLGGGEHHSCALDTQGSVWCWGSNNVGQLGGGTTGDSTAPIQVVTDADLPLLRAINIGLGDDHSCAVRGDGTAWCWGSNNKGQLGHGMEGVVASSNKAVQVEDVNDQPLTGVTSIDGGNSFSCALVGDGTVYCWGNNAYGQLGNGAPGFWSDVAVQVIDSNDAPLQLVKQLSVGHDSACAVTAYNTVWCWGRNVLGVLGDGTTTNRSKAVQVLNHSDVVQVSVGASTACSVKTDSTAWCWGSGSHGALGDGTTISKTYPVKVHMAAGQPLTGVAEVSSSTSAACARTASGGVYCWGADWLGQAGVGSYGDIILWATPVKRMDNGLALLSVTALSRAHSMHVCAAQSTAGGAVWCWGSNFAGQLGDGTITNRNKATEVPSFTVGPNYFTL